MTRARQRGFTMVTAIFILVVLAALSAAIVTVSTSQQIGSALDVQGSRAYQAARAGIEWGLYQVWAGQGATHPAADRASASCPQSPSSFQPSAPTLADFVVTVHCLRIPDPNPSGGGPATFRVEAWACNAPTPGWTATTDACPGSASNTSYVERYLVVTF